MVLENRSPYPIRALFNYKHNPMQNMPNNAKTAEFLKKLDLVVTIDTMPSDTVMLSDVILPECTYLERTDPVVSFGGIEPAIAQRNKVIDPMFESKPVMEIMGGLSAKLTKQLQSKLSICAAISSSCGYCAVGATAIILPSQHTTDPPQAEG